MAADLHEDEPPHKSQAIADDTPATPAEATAMGDSVEPIKGYRYSPLPDSTEFLSRLFSPWDFQLSRDLLSVCSFLHSST
eukprot:4002472-Pyramimonas_sp.AAC.1